MKRLLAALLSVLFLMTVLPLSAKVLAEESAPAPVKPAPRTDKIIFVGDSRGVGMQRWCAEKLDKYIVQGGKSWYWFLGAAIPKIRKILTRDPNYSVVIMMGVNDCTNRVYGALESYSHYADAFITLKKEFPNSHFFYCSVNPVDAKYRLDGHRRNLRLHLNADDFNAVIDEFNEGVKKGCTETEYLDCSHDLGPDSFVTTDGLHYTEATYRTIYAYLTSEVVRRIHAEDTPSVPQS